MASTNFFKYTPEERVSLFFRHVKKELGKTSTLQIFQLVRKIFASIGRGLTTSQLMSLVDQLPGIFQLLIVVPPRPSLVGHRSCFRHLDELVESIYEEDKSSGHSIFSTEVDALNAVVLVLRKMDKYMNLFSYNILKYPVVKELRQIPAEEPA